jgi:hypothetical protein
LQKSRRQRLRDDKRRQATTSDDGDGDGDGDERRRPTTNDVTA